MALKVERQPKFKEVDESVSSNLSSNSFLKTNQSKTKEDKVIAKFKKDKDEK